VEAEKMNRAHLAPHKQRTKGLHYCKEKLHRKSGAIHKQDILGLFLILVGPLEPGLLQFLW
jgi:hypothetical protein